MSVTYEISRWDSITGAMNARDHIKVKRRDAAERHLYRMIYEMVASDAALDTKRGWEAVREYDAAIADGTVSPPRHGYYRNKRFHLRGDMWGAFVEIMVTRDHIGRPTGSGVPLLPA